MRDYTIAELKQIAYGGHKVRQIGQRWVCDKCGAEFRTKDMAESHEANGGWEK